MLVWFLGFVRVDKKLVTVKRNERKFKEKEEYTF